MKILLTEWFSDWRHAEPQKPNSVVLDLEDEKALFYLAVSLGNGTFDQARFEQDSKDAYRFVVNLLKGTGGASLTQPDEASMQSALYRENYEIYRQGLDAFFFVDPQPRPELFANEGVASWIRN